MTNAQRNLVNANGHQSVIWLFKAFFEQLFFNIDLPVPSIAPYGHRCHSLLNIPEQRCYMYVVGCILFLYLLQ